MNVLIAVNTTWFSMKMFRSLPLMERTRRVHPYASILQGNLVH